MILAILVFIFMCAHARARTTGRYANGKIFSQIPDGISIPKMNVLYNPQKTKVYDIVGWTIYIYIKGETDSTWHTEPGKNRTMYPMPVPNPEPRTGTKLITLNIVLKP